MNSPSSQQLRELRTVEMGNAAWTIVDQAAQVLRVDSNAVLELLVKMADGQRVVEPTGASCWLPCNQERCRN